MSPLPSAAVRVPTLKGRWDVAGLWLPHAWYSESQRAHLVLRYWGRGAQLYRFARGGDLLVFGRSLQARCETLPGWPLILQDGRLRSAALSDEERKNAPRADCCLVEAGQMTPLFFHEGEAMDPADGLSLEGLTLLEPLALEPPEPLLEVDLPKGSANIREILDTIEEPPDSQKNMLDYFRGKHAEAKKSRIDPLTATVKKIEFKITPAIILFILVGFTSLAKIMGFSSRGGGGFGIVFAILIILFILFLLVRFFLPAVKSGMSRVTSPHAATSPRGAPPSSSWIKQRARYHRHKSSPVWGWLARMAALSGLGAVLGKRQAKYLHTMMEMFEREDFKEALRHALPLSPPGEDADAARPDFGVPRRRDNIDIRPHRGNASASLFLDEGVERYLRSLYQQAFERLDAQGRIDEAAFVLVDLLGQEGTALDYLEKHKRYQQAAKLALGWDMAPDVIVRLFCLAEAWSYAVTVARRDNAFANAVLLLEKNHPESSQTLREEWAAWLASKGELLDAITVLWPLENKRGQAQEWLRHLEEQGGELEGAALVKRALLLPDTLDRYEESLQRLCRQSDPAARNRLAQELLRVPTPDQKAVSGLARAVLRPVLRDHLRAGIALTKSDLRCLAKMANDPLLIADLPPKDWSDTRPRPFSAETEPRKLTAPAAGLPRDCADVVLVGEHHYLMALGEAGVVMVDRHGQECAFFPVPATHFVISHNRQVALLLIRREETWRVSRLEVTARSITDLGNLTLQTFSPTFDGIAWTTVQGRRVQVLDTARGLKPLWQLNHVPGNVVGISTLEKDESWLIFLGDGAGWELWRYELPQRTLRQRDHAEESPQWMVPDHPDQLWRIDLDIIQEKATIIMDNAFEGDRQNEFFKEIISIPTENYPDLSKLRITKSCIAIPAHHDLWIIDKEKSNILAELSWPGEFNLRQQNGHFLVYDNKGRLLHLDPEGGTAHALSLR